MAKNSTNQITPNEKKTNFFDVLKQTACGVLIAGALTTPTACNSDSNGKGEEKNTEKKEVIVQTSDQSKTDVAEFTTNGENESKGKPSLEPDPEHGGRKIVKTETFKDEDGHSITKNVYEDGSMSEGYEENRRVYEYTEYYPNSNIEKFHIFKDGHYVGSSRRREAWTSYIIRDEQGKILYEEGWAGPDGCDGLDEFNKYDEKGRLIYRVRDNENKLIYDDENNTVSHIIEQFNALYKQISVYSLDKRGEINRDNEISRVFVGETGVEIDLMNGGVEKLINDRNLNDIPNIRDYNGYGIGE